MKPYLWNRLLLACAFIGACSISYFLGVQNGAISPAERTAMMEAWYSYYELNEIPRDEVAAALSSAMLEIKDDPKSAKAYNDAARCFYILGTDAELIRLRLEADRHGIIVDFRPNASS
jgi:hypothetical protein